MRLSEKIRECTDPDDFWTKVFAEWAKEAEMLEEDLKAEIESRNELAELVGIR